MLGSIVVNGKAATFAASLSLCGSVTALKKVLLPALGLPISPIVSFHDPLPVLPAPSATSLLLSYILLLSLLVLF